MPVEIERRFLIRGSGPSDWLVPFRDEHIVQTYLGMPPGSRPGSTERVRVSIPTDGGSVLYTHTTKNPLPPQATAGLTGGNQEAEREIVPGTYRRLLRRADITCVPVCKVRRTFTWPPTPEEGTQRVFELDTYGDPFKGLVVLEVELPSFEAPLVLPPFLDLECEVTGDKKYSNYGLTKAGRVP